MSTGNHRLRPNETIHKALISTTSRLVGEYESDSILIDHAWPDFSNHFGFARYYENPASRSAFIVVFQTEPYEKGPGVVVPNYSSMGELVCSYLSLIYGKRFDNHGLIESNGIYQIPDLSMYTSLSNPRLPFNSHRERKCFGVPLDLSQFSVVSRIVSGTGLDQKLLHRLNTACKFYMQALQNAETDYEASYIQLIMSGEIIAQHFDYRKEDLLDKEMLKILKRIEKHLDDGNKVAKQVSNRVSAIKRRFVKSISCLIDNEFFLSRESDSEHGFFKAADFPRRIGAAYDLRSKYVHTGVPFGRWIGPGGSLEDIQTGRPIVEDKEYAKVLAKAPTLVGLERVIRYCLLKFMISNGFQDIEKIRSGGDGQTGCCGDRSQ